MKTRDAEGAPGAGTATAEPEDHAGYPAADPAPATFRPLVVVTVAALSVIDGELRCLLAPEGTPGGRGDGVWSLPGHAARPEEHLEDAARGELPAGARRAAYVEQLYTREERRPGTDAALQILYLALVGAGARGDDSLRAVWWPVSRLPRLAAGTDAILEQARQRARRVLTETSAAASLLPPEFAFSDLQRVYEVFRGSSLDKRNFRKWILGNRWIEATPKLRRDGAHRPARLYRFVGLGD